MKDKVYVCHGGVQHELHDECELCSKIQKHFIDALESGTFEKFLPHSTQEEMRENDFRKEICTCNKQWLDNDTHFANCPVFTYISLLSQHKQKLEERVRVIRVKAVMHPLIALIDGEVKTLNDYNSGFDKALEDVLSALKEME